MSMKRFLSFLLILSSWSAYAGERDLESARSIAYDFLESRVLTKSSNISLGLVHAGPARPQTRTSGSTPSLYVFDNEVGPGFVIVSGDDAVQKILAYSFDSNFKADNIPSNLSWWLDTMDSQVENLRRTGAIAPDSEVDPGVASVLYETAKWDQGGPFNDQCPSVMIDGKLHYALTGCGPTAIAIVLRYKEYPRSGKGVTREYVTYQDQIKVPSRELGQEYVWEEMPLYAPSRKAWTDVQKEQVSRLISDIGAAAEVAYGLSATSISGYDVAPALIKHFGYDRSAYLAERGFYVDKEWIPMIKQELRDNGPVIYSGSSQSSGHMFVLDGYDSNDYFHVNWGWSGSSDGYYSLSAMNPGDPDAKPGSVAHLNGYNRLQDAVLNLVPDRGGKETMQIYFYNPTLYEKAFKGLFVKECDSVTGLPSVINIGAILNEGQTTCYGLKIRLVVVDRDENVRKVVWEETVEAFRPSETIYYQDVALPDLGAIDFGYTLIGQYYDSDFEEWKKIRADRTEWAVEKIALADEFSIAESTTFKYENSTRMITLTTKKGVEVACFGNGIEYAVDNSETNTFMIDAAPLDAGVYTIRFSKGSETHELRFVVGTKKEE